MALVRTTCCLVAAMGWVMSATSSRASVLLEVDLSDTSNVTVTATAGTSDTDSSLNMSFEGFTIENFFTSAVDFSATAVVGGDLRSVLGAAGPYAFFGTFEFDDDNGLFTTANDMSVIADGNLGAASQVFSTGTQAFSGAGSMDLSSVAASLPGTGTSGNLYTGFFKTGQADHGEVIGTWLVVPEPPAEALGIASLLTVGLLWCRRTLGS